MIIVLFYSSIIIAQNTGYVNFNLHNSKIKPQEKYKNQGVTLIGCNTTVTNADNKYWKKAPQGLQWHTNNQVFEDLPYGKQVDTKTQKPYYVSKYYIASPPVFLRNKKGKSTKNTQYDIGIVTPDEFVFKGDKPIQQVYLDYDILELMKIKYIAVKPDESFRKMNINQVPFNVECKNFPWLNKGLYKRGKGASGIGVLKRNPDNKLGNLFLPYYENKLETNQKKIFLDCKVTILNDILFHHEIYFKVNGKKQYTINLKEFYEKHKDDEKIEIKLYCEYKEELPCGCEDPNREQSKK